MNNCNLEYEILLNLCIVVKRNPYHTLRGGGCDLCDSQVSYFDYYDDGALGDYDTMVMMLLKMMMTLAMIKLMPMTMMLMTMILTRVTRLPERLLRSRASMSDIWLSVNGTVRTATASSSLPNSRLN